MKKAIAAATVGLLLVSGQALAAGQAAGVSRVGDRVGASADGSSEFAGVPLIGILAAAGIIVATVAIVSGDDDSDSD